jgi:ATP-binding cassette subfamily B protein
MGFGPGAFGGGPSSVQANAAAGLPYAGVPGKLGEEVERVLAGEPTHAPPDVHFDRARWDHRPFTLRTGPARRPGCRRLLVVVETIAASRPAAHPDRHRPRRREGQRECCSLSRRVRRLGDPQRDADSPAAFTAGSAEADVRARIRTFSHLERQSLSFFTNEKAGVLMTRMTSDIEALSQLFQEGIVNFLVQALTLVVITVILFTLNAHLALLTVAMVVPLTFVLSVWFRRASDKGYRRVRDRISDVLSDLSESLAGIRIIAAYNRRRRNVANHVNVVGEHLDANLYTARAGALYAPGTEAIGVLAQAMLLAVGGRMVLSGDLSIGTMSAFLLYVTAFFAPIQQLVALYTSYQQGQASVRKLRELLATEPDVIEAPTPSTEGRGDIVLDHVTFGYDASQPVLHDISLHIPSASLAVVIATGASSPPSPSSSRFDPDAGVLIDGHDSARSARRAAPRRAAERSFHGTIRDNVAFRHPDATDDGVYTRAAVGTVTSSTAYPTASMHRCTNAVRPCPPVSDSCSRSPARSSRNHACSFSTKRRPTSTCAPKPPSSGLSTPCCGAAPPSSSPTGSLPRCVAIASRSSRTAPSSSSTAPTRSWPKGAGSPTCTPRGSPTSTLAAPTCDGALMSSVIDLRGVSKATDERPILRDIDWQVGQGERSSSGATAAARPPVAHRVALPASDLRHGDGARRDARRCDVRRLQRAHRLLQRIVRRHAAARFEAVEVVMTAKHAAPSRGTSTTPRIERVPASSSIGSASRISARGNSARCRRVNVSACCSPAP